ncbi:hypothetical protein [Peterkaempfera bronchialis]|uniref:hypothetical protein n=1 Tax=Peterkaempfera bronchialis TaxID=2126346 RepID=UPI003C2E6A60
MSTAHLTSHPRAVTVPRQASRQAPPPVHGGNPLKSALRKAGILAGTVARVTLLGRDGVDL